MITGKMKKSGGVVKAGTPYLIGNGDRELFIPSSGDFVFIFDSSTMKNKTTTVGEYLRKPCPYCGNTSGRKDARGGCISCGGME
jgi:hypothetical protein